MHAPPFFVWSSRFIIIVGATLAVAFSSHNTPLYTISDEAAGSSCGADHNPSLTPTDSDWEKTRTTQCLAINLPKAAAGKLGGDASKECVYGDGTKWVCTGSQVCTSDDGVAFYGCQGKECGMLTDAAEFKCDKKSLENLWLANNRGEQAVSIRYLWRRSLLIVYECVCAFLIIFLATFILLRTGGSLDDDHEEEGGEQEDGAGEEGENADGGGKKDRAGSEDSVESAIRRGTMLSTAPLGSVMEDDDDEARFVALALHG